MDHFGVHNYNFKFSWKMSLISFLSGAWYFLPILFGKIAQALSDWMHTIGEQQCSKSYLRF